MTLSYAEGQAIAVQGLLDSGAAVNVMPYTLGIRLGAVWQAQTTKVQLTGNLGAHEARALLVRARIADLAPVRLVFAWTQADDVPLLLGQMNFFEEFEVCFHRRRVQFEVQPASR